jgi:hypothetical protein
MNYEKIYHNFIESRRNMAIKGYSEVHHIIPTSLGGKDVGENKIVLSARDHYFAHRLLAKFAGPEMILALKMMCDVQNIGERFKPNSRAVAFAREQAAKVISEKLTGRILSKTHVLNISKNTHLRKLTKEQILKRIESRKIGKGYDQNKGSKRSIETKELLSVKAKQRKKVQCPHCNKIGAKPQMVQWHFENCKEVMQ